MLISKKSYYQGFTLIELLVVIAIIGIISTLAIVAFSGVRAKANDAKRKFELTQIGKFFSTTCYVPESGVGTYDLADLITELKAKDEKYRQLISIIPHDPKSGSETKANYIYIVNDDKKCTLYGNLENANEKNTLNISEPTPGAGNGVFESATSGVNGTKKYFQVTN